jgi:hypothetical protein
LLYLLLLFSANCTTFAAVSATASRRFGLLFSATCTGFGASSAACMGTGYRDTAHADQAGNAKARKQFFQILFFHGGLP